MGRSPRIVRAATALWMLQGSVYLFWVIQGLASTGVLHYLNAVLGAAFLVIGAGTLIGKLEQLAGAAIFSLIVGFLQMVGFVMVVGTDLAGWRVAMVAGSAVAMITASVLALVGNAAYRSWRRSSEPSVTPPIGEGA